MTDLTAWTPPQMPCTGPLTGRHTVLERLDVARHGPELWTAFETHDALWAWMFVGPFQDRAAFMGWLDEAVRTTDTVFYAVRDLRSGRASGITSYLRDTPAMGVIEIGNITYAPCIQRSAVTTEASVLLLAQAFEAGYRRVEWKCNARNLPSRRAAQRLGFGFEGIFRNHMIVKGRSRDTAWFAIIREDWPDLRAVFDAWLAPDNFAPGGQQRRALGPQTAPLRAGSDPAL